ncbi:heat shock 70 kDa protein 12A-like isoform X6 [Dreissena polymorpha]|uniref:heat shock 70 kDa protein 12A-like isoform X1 n=1 Tax=Dreissena polymorpha TaxID=45954 RepID=UPI0022640962|nr:heat shock 70 kDa protein 12A-like isoform X1 [Dreissena polymorpha]XP_052215039.1 heat shock 70 kDa protein 12A-like isoform X2 [Dreissena polymorpha]XP_052215041.1 heat shock 70 kDa protein 12A-like isoform X3 [Dreissena polymorpha]XP_052215042.1 heat shock 70 kDa protein 12A-like isoform X4 [Dreissena polymorpha]XP_052215044.1 heat shock 70 kDa protein 12A-like isoform X6 [Dreissena polymorpha]
MAAKSGALIVAAIDFGTTYSGWAFSSKNDFEMEPVKVSAKTWIGGQLSSLKAPTCILIKPDGKTFEAFGFEAESRYAELCEENEHKKWFYFRRFKMALWNKDIHKDTVLEDVSGRELPALTVFSLSIRFMKDGMTEMSNNQVAGLKPDDVHWVLTVPAIWNDSAKHFMRLAAEKAGISVDKLTLSLEPEAASLYCRHITVQKSGETNISKFTTGKKYLVLDAGGGTIDITVHEVCERGTLKEIHKASGGYWGGTKVDEAFIEFLSEITDVKAMKRFKDENMEDYIDLLREFEIKKRAIDTNTSSKVTIKVPLSLSDLSKEITGILLQDKLPTTRYGKQVSLAAGGKSRLDADVMRTFFNTSMSNIIDHVSGLLQTADCSGVETILMVGGYSESSLLQETMKKRFSKLCIIVPPDAGLAVLKGAVIYGHCPTAIIERVSKCTYGISITEMYDDKRHNMWHRKVYEDGSARCVDVFSIFVRAGDKLVAGETQNEKTYRPINAGQVSAELPIFATTDPNPRYTTDIGTKKIGSVNVPLSGRGTDRSVVVRMIFGGTEITVECEEKTTGKITRLNVDFLM